MVGTHLICDGEHSYYLSSASGGAGERSAEGTAPPPQRAPSPSARSGSSDPPGTGVCPGPPPDPPRGSPAAQSTDRDVSIQACERTHTRPHVSWFYTDLSANHAEMNGTKLARVSRSQYRHFCAPSRLKDKAGTLVAASVVLVAAGGDASPAGPRLLRPPDGADARARTLYEARAERRSSPAAPACKRCGSPARRGLLSLSRCLLL